MDLLQDANREEYNEVDMYLNSPISINQQLKTSSMLGIFVSRTQLAPEDPELSFNSPIFVCLSHKRPLRPFRVSSCVIYSSHCFFSKNNKYFLSTFKSFWPLRIFVYCLPRTLRLFANPLFTYRIRPNKIVFTPNDYGPTTSYRFSSLYPEAWKYSQYNRESYYLDWTT